MEIIEAREKYIIVKEENIKYIVYVDNSEYIYEEKNIVYIKGNVIEIENDLDLDIFAFSDYLKNKRIFYQIDNDYISFISHTKTISNRIINLLTSKLENDSLKTTKMLLFNDKRNNLDNYNNLKDINALHLFVVSGFHISFLFSIMEKVFKKFKGNTIIASIICLFYVFLLGFTISSTRAFMTLILGKFFKKYFNRIDCISIPGIFFLFVDPLNVFNYSFILTFTMCFGITFISSVTKNSNKFVQIILTAVLCFIIMFPIQLKLNNEINLISLISNFFLSYIVSFIFILCILGIFISPFKGTLFDKIYSLFNNAISFLSNLDTKIIFGNVSFVFLILFYYFFVIFLVGVEWKKKGIIINSLIAISISIACLYNRNVLSPYQSVTFLNVYQGDCTIIQDCKSNKVMLIDTGGLTYYDIAQNKIIPYLKYHGIRKIDIVVATHDDYDHCGALEELESLIKIDKIIRNTEYLNEINLGNISLKNLNHYYTELSEENEKSIVLYGKINSLYYLFAADMGVEIENKIISENPNLKVDVLKVGHHGSNTSSSESFISTIMPKYSIISCGKNNIYGHPHKAVVSRLEQYNSQILRTDVQGTIRFKGNLKDFYFIETAK